MRSALHSGSVQSGGSRSHSSHNQIMLERRARADNALRTLFCVNYRGVSAHTPLGHTARLGDNDTRRVYCGYLTCVAPFLMLLGWIMDFAGALCSLACLGLFIKSTHQPTLNFDARIMMHRRLLLFTFCNFTLTCWNNIQSTNCDFPLKVLRFHHKVLSTTVWWQSRHRFLLKATSREVILINKKMISLLKIICYDLEVFRF